MLERGIKIFSCFLDVQKGFDTLWVTLWAVYQTWYERPNVVGNKEFVYDVKARDLYSASLV